MGWLLFLIFVLLVVALAVRGVKKHHLERDASAITEATINSSGVEKRRADGTHESVTWEEIHTIELIHRVTDRRRANEVVSGFLIGRDLPVDDPTLLVFHAEENGAVVPAWPEIVGSLLIQMRHRCSMGTKELGVVQARIELRERGNYVLWTRSPSDSD